MHSQRTCLFWRFNSWNSADRLPGLIDRIFSWKDDLSWFWLTTMVLIHNGLIIIVCFDQNDPGASSASSGGHRRKILWCLGIRISWLNWSSQPWQQVSWSRRKSSLLPFELWTSFQPYVRASLNGCLGTTQSQSRRNWKLYYVPLWSKMTLYNLYTTFSQAIAQLYSTLSKTNTRSIKVHSTVSWQATAWVTIKPCEDMQIPL